MKLSLKLALGFATAMLLLFLCGMFGIYKLNRAIASYETEVLQTVDSHKRAAEVASNLAAAIQEWKNTLLRGKDPKDLDKYWSAHQKEMGEAQALLKTLEGNLASGPAKDLARKLTESLNGAAAAYRKAYDDFKAADLDSAAGDKAVRGKDREALKLLDELKVQLSKEEKAAAESASAQAKTASLLALAMMVLVTLGSLVTVIWWSRNLIRPLSAAVGIVDRVAHGDLTNAIRPAGHDEIGMLMRSLIEMQTGLTTLVRDVRQGAESIASASSEIAQGNNDLSARTEQQAGALEETASSMEQLTSTVRQNADNARQANQLAISASEVATRGGTVVSQVVDTMGSINESSRRIVDIISVIDGIAFQTNILALNAAVEAARAGEQGRGFAVVASEVRNLAQRSAAAAKEIKELIGTSVEKVDIGSKLVDQAGATMAEVVDSIRRVTDIMAEITAASAEQSDGIEQVNRAITEMDNTTQQNAALVEQAAAAAEAMTDQAANLEQTTSVFKIEGSVMGAHTANTARSAHSARPAPQRAKPAAPMLARKAAPAAAPRLAVVKSQAKASKAGADEWEEF